MIEVKNITKSYGSGESRFQVLQNISLEIKDRDFVVILGASGSGKMSPIDAVRNGQTGERFRKMSIMSLGRSKLPATPFLALNDIVSSPKRFAIITFAFFLCLSLLLILSSTVFTMKGGTFGGALGLADFDVSAKCKAVEFITEDGHEKLKEYLSDMEKNLAENNKFMITALFQSMNNLGEGVRLHEDMEIDYIQAQGAIFTLIKFTDAPNQKEIARRMEKIQVLYPEFDGVKNRAECISDDSRLF